MDGGLFRRPLLLKIFVGVNLLLHTGGPTPFTHRVVVAVVVHYHFLPIDLHGLQQHRKHRKHRKH